MNKQINNVINSGLRYTLIVLMGTAVLNVLWQVFTRFILRDPSSYTEELARYLLIWIGLLGAAYCVGHKMHLAIDILTVKLQGKMKCLLEIFIQLSISLFALFVMVLGGIRLVNITLTLKQISAALQIQLGYVYIVIPLSGILILNYSVNFMIEEFKMLTAKQ
jgi:TRAP-type C4-dicarboxylate transport system permease small subunit